VNVVDLPQRERLPRVPFQVKIFSGDALAAARWSSVTDTRDFRMYVFQSRVQMRRVRRFVAASGVRTWFRAAS